MIIISLPVILTGLFFTFEKRLTQTWMRWVWWIVCTVIVVIVGLKVGPTLISSTRFGDFNYAYYVGGRAAITDITQLYPQEVCINGYVNFPLSAYLFVPFALFSIETAALLFYLLSYISIMPLAYWLIKFTALDGWKSWFILTLLIINDGLDETLDYGNTTQFIMISMLIALWLFKNGKGWGTGILLGLNGLIKIPIIIPAGYFFILRQWKVVGGGLFVAVLAIVLSLMLIPFSLNQEWLNECILSFSEKIIVAFNNQSISGFLGRLLMPESDIYTWTSVIPLTGFSVISNLFLVLFYIPAIILMLIDWKTPRTPSEHVLGFLILLVCSILTSPISWTHYYMLLLIPVALYLKENKFEMHKFWLNLLYVSSVILLSSQTSLALFLFERTDQSLFLSLPFIGGVLLYLLLLIDWYTKRYYHRKPSLLN